MDDETLATIVLDLWELIKSHVSVKEKDDVCLDFVTIFDNNGFNLGKLGELHGEDRDIDRAIEHLYEDGHDEEDDEEYDD